MRQTLGIYYYFTRQPATNPFTRFEALTPNLLEGFGDLSNTRSQQWNISHEWAVNNSSVNEFRFTYFREAHRELPEAPAHQLVTNSCSGSAVHLLFHRYTRTRPVFLTSSPKMGITPGLRQSRRRAVHHNFQGLTSATIMKANSAGGKYLPMVG